jgi:hypothetical protein
LMPANNAHGIQSSTAARIQITQTTARLCPYGG